MGVSLRVSPSILRYSYSKLSERSLLFSFCTLEPALQLSQLSTFHSALRNLTLGSLFCSEEKWVLSAYGLQVRGP